MKELNFRFTNHDSYSLARSFIIMFGMIIFASISDIIMVSLPVDWFSMGNAGVAIRGASMAICAGFGIYLGFRITLKLFDNQGSIIIKDNIVILKKGRKEQSADIKDIVEVRKEMFAKFDGLRYKDSKAFGPLFTKHSIVTKERELFALASVQEGWMKAGKEVFGRENPVPLYSIDDAFKELARHVDEVKKQEKDESAEYEAEGGLI